MQTRWLNCEIAKGMFDNECAVEIKLPTSEIISFFVDRSLIQSKLGKHYVKVNLVKSDNEDQKEWRVLLPIESFENGSRWISLPSSERLIEA
jgi:hypothetical protein